MILYAGSFLLLSPMGLPGSQCRTRRTSPRIYGDGIFRIRHGIWHFLFLFPEILDQFDDDVDRICFLALFHGPDVSLSVLPYSGDSLRQGIFGEILLFQNIAEALFLKRAGIQNLVAAAGSF